MTDEQKPKQYASIQYFGNNNDLSLSIAVNKNIVSKSRMQ